MATQSPLIRSEASDVRGRPQLYPVYYVQPLPIVLEMANKCLNT